MSSYVLDGRKVSREEFMAGAPGFTPGQPPAVVTDAILWEGHCNGNQFADRPELGDHYKKQALRAGVNPKGKIYKKGLARFPGDPEAWISTRGDIQRLCDKYGHEADGIVTRKGRRQEAPEIDVAPDLVQAEAERVAEATGADVTPELKEQIKEKRKPTWARKGKKKAVTA